MQVVTESSPTISFDTDIELKKYGRIVKTGWISPFNLVVADTNCRITQITDAEKLEMNRSVAENGIIDPVVINDRNEIVKGQLRWDAALRVGQESIPYIMVKFANKYSEMIVSFMDDTLKHPLTHSDKAAFIHRLMAVEGNTYEKIAADIGKDVATIRQWAGLEIVPPVILGDKELVKRYNESSQDKKMAIKTTLKQSQFRDDIDEQKKYVNMALEASIDELDELRKNAIREVPLNIEGRTRKLKEVKSHALLKVNISKALRDKFYEVLKKVKKDPDDVVESLILEFIRQNSS